MGEAEWEPLLLGSSFYSIPVKFNVERESSFSEKHLRGIFFFLLQPCKLRKTHRDWMKISLRLPRRRPLPFSAPVSAGLKRKSWNIKSTRWEWKRVLCCGWLDGWPRSIGKINILLRRIFFFLCYPLSVGWVSVMSCFFFLSLPFSFVGWKSRAIMKMYLFEIHFLGGFSRVMGGERQESVNKDACYILSLSRYQR